MIMPGDDAKFNKLITPTAMRKLNFAIRKAVKQLELGGNKRNKLGSSSIGRRRSPKPEVGVRFPPLLPNKE